jgi:hypothetical protein
MQQTRNTHIHVWQLVAFCLTFTALSRSEDSTKTAQASEGLRPVAYLVGGTWHSDAKWPDGTPFEVDVSYMWGPTHRVIHFQTYEPSDGKLTLIYEGLLYFDPRRSKIIQMNFKPSGEVNESEITPVNDEAYEVLGAKTKSIVRRKDENEFVWELYLPQGNDWKQILQASYTRGK